MHQSSTMSRKVMAVSGIGWLAWDRDGAARGVEDAASGGAGPAGGGGSCDAAAGPRSSAREMVSRPRVHSADTVGRSLMLGDRTWS